MARRVADEEAARLQRFTAELVPRCREVANENLQLKNMCMQLVERLEAATRQINSGGAV